MSCLKNPKKLLWIKYNGDHTYKPVQVWKFMDCSDDFCVRFRCLLCGAETTEHFIEWDELQGYGLTNEQINRIGTIRPFSDESLTINY